MPRVFSDFDNTFSTHPELGGITDAIVTGRSWEESQDLYDEAGDLTVPVFFNPVTSQENTLQKIILHKAEIINRCGVTKFFEDMPNEAAQLKILCPNCKVILVKPGVTAI